MVGGTPETYNKWHYFIIYCLQLSKGEIGMQIHMRRLVEVTKDIDGFKENMAYFNHQNILGGLCHEKHHRKGILQRKNRGNA